MTKRFWFLTGVACGAFLMLFIETILHIHVYADSYIMDAIPWLSGGMCFQ